MQKLRQSMRPKHQVLILKCYPRDQKNNPDARPNSSELSYLLYYASTRRTKLQKVGVFLEKIIAHDVPRGRAGNVQVTFKILKALIEKCPHELPLYSEYVLNILLTVLRSNDVNFVEQSVEVFDAFCTQHDSATLSADQEHGQQYDEIVQKYANYSSNDITTNGKNAINVPKAIRFRNAGLNAIKSLVSSDSFALDSRRHAAIVIPTILQNLYSDKPNHFSLLEYRHGCRETLDRENQERRRPSMSVGRESVAIRESNEVDPAIAAGTTADVDQRANEDLGVLALQCLRQIFGANNRSQLRISTNAVLLWTVGCTGKFREYRDAELGSVNTRNWFTELYESMCRWAPVQDRFVILVAAMEILIQSPIIEEDLPNQLFLAHTISYLLRSSVTFVGLSVIDVLIGLIQHTLLLLQLGGSGSHLRPHHQQADGIIGSVANKLSLTSKLAANDASSAPPVMEMVGKASGLRLVVLERLQQCIGNLATHVYYSDQISDMVSALLLRLKPSPASGFTHPASAIENPSAAAEAIANSVNLHAKQQSSGFFSFDTARVLALEAVKMVLAVANTKRRDGLEHGSRNRVGVSVWEGTQWLLRDTDGRVRKAYIDAVLTWLALELDKNDLRLTEQQPRATRTSGNHNGAAEEIENSFSRRAISNASQRARLGNRKNSSFLQLLHLAVYENALQYACSQEDISLLHLLLVSLVTKLGVNAVRFGLPMIFTLQEQEFAPIDAASKIAIGSLVHGYFWAVSGIFEFESSPIGRSIQDEIARRGRHGLWLENIQLPPLPLCRIETPGTGPDMSDLASQVVPTESLRTLDARHEMVDRISDHYGDISRSPPSSPLPQARRTASSVSTNRRASVHPFAKHERTLPSNIKAQMLHEWSKEDCIESARVETAKSVSMRGSKQASIIGGQQNLIVNRAREHTSDPALQSTQSLLNSQEQPRRKASPVYDILGFPSAMHFAQDQITCRLSRNGSGTPLSELSQQDLVRVADLKRVLAGIAPVGFRSTSARQAPATIDDSTSDSMVSASVSMASDRSGQASGDAQHHIIAYAAPQGPSPWSRNLYELNADVPPIPSLANPHVIAGAPPRELREPAPARAMPSINGSTTQLQANSENTPQAYRGSSQPAVLRGVVGNGPKLMVPSLGVSGGRKMNLAQLLDEIDTNPRRGVIALERPPY